MYLYNNQKFQELLFECLNFISCAFLPLCLSTTPLCLTMRLCVLSQSVHACVQFFPVSPAPLWFCPVRLLPLSLLLSCELLLSLSLTRAYARARGALSLSGFLFLSRTLSLSLLLLLPSLLSLFLSFASSPVLLLSKRSLHQQSPHAWFWLAVGRTPWAAKWWWYTPPWRRWMQEPETALTQTHSNVVHISAKHIFARCYCV